MRHLVLAAALLPLPAAALTPAIIGPETGVWQCLDPTGTPSFAFSITDNQGYVDPGGGTGTFVMMDWGVLQFLDGIWAGYSAVFVPGIMTLLPSGPDRPVICVLD